MQTKTILTCCFAIAFFAILSTTRLSSNTVSPPANTCDAPPSNATCTSSGCHPAPAVASNALILTTFVIDTITDGFSSPIPLTSSFKYGSKGVYDIGFGLSASTGVYGFQITSLSASNTMAGAFLATNTSNTEVVTANSIQYMGHYNANSTETWDFQWTAPAGSTGPVTFYYTYLTAASDAETATGTTYEGSLTIQSSSHTSGINDIALENAINTYPIPAREQLTAQSDFLTGSDVIPLIYDMTGKSVPVAFSRAGDKIIFNTANLPSGIYLIHFNMNGVEVCKRFVKAS